MSQKKLLAVSEIKHWRLLSSWLFLGEKKGEVELFNHEDNKNRTALLKLSVACPGKKKKMTFYCGAVKLHCLELKF